MDNTPFLFLFIIFIENIKNKYVIYFNTFSNFSSIGKGNNAVTSFTISYPKSKAYFIDLPISIYLSILF